jgi:hypothetical protein
LKLANQKMENIDIIRQKEWRQEEERKWVLENLEIVKSAWWKIFPLVAYRAVLKSEWVSFDDE